MDYARSRRCCTDGHWAGCLVALYFSFCFNPLALYFLSLSPLSYLVPVARLPPVAPSVRRGRVNLVTGGAR